jgi:hypothetical protein
MPGSYIPAIIHKAGGVLGADGYLSFPLPAQPGNTLIETRLLSHRRVPCEKGCVIALLFIFYPVQLKHKYSHAVADVDAVMFLVGHV